MTSIKGKKAVMGIGVLIIFIASILVAAVAAGVVIRSTSQLQQRSLEVEESARERIVNRVDIVSIDAVGNTTSELITGFEVLARLGPGSYSIDLNEIGMTYSSNEVSAAARYFSENTPSLCNSTTPTTETEFCFQEVFGDGNNVLAEGELIKIIYTLNSTHYMNTSQEFEMSFIPTRGDLVTLDLRTPKVVNKIRTKIRS